MELSKRSNLLILYGFSGQYSSANRTQSSMVEATPMQNTHSPTFGTAQSIGERSSRRRYAPVERYDLNRLLPIPREV